MKKNADVLGIVLFAVAMGLMCAMMCHCGGPEFQTALDPRTPVEAGVDVGPESSPPADRNLPLAEAGAQEASGPTWAPDAGTREDAGDGWAPYPYCNPCTLDEYVASGLEMFECAPGGTGIVAYNGVYPQDKIQPADWFCSYSPSGGKDGGPQIGWWSFSSLGCIQGDCSCASIHACPGSLACVPADPSAKPFPKVAVVLCK